MGKRGAAEELPIDWVTLFRPSPEPSPPSAADLAPRSARSADCFSASSPAHPVGKRGGGARVDIDWCSMFRPGTPEPPEAQPSPPPAAAVVPRSAGVETDEQIMEWRKRARKAAEKPKKSEDPMVRVMEMYVEMKKKQVEDAAALLAKERAESRNVQDFSIGRCIHMFCTEWKASDVMRGPGHTMSSEMLKTVRSSWHLLPWMKKPLSCGFGVKWPSCLDLPRGKGKHRRSPTVVHTRPNYVHDIDSSGQRKRW